MLSHALACPGRCSERELYTEQDCNELPGSYAVLVASKLIAVVLIGLTAWLPARATTPAARGGFGAATAAIALLPEPRAAPSPRRVASARSARMSGGVCDQPAD